MNMQRLKYFIAVAEEMNFGRAAERLRIAQPALSRQIALLEDELSTLLFDRSRSSIRITQAGQILLERAREIVDQLGAVAREVTAVGSGSAGTLSVGLVSSANCGVLPDLIKAFVTKYPLIELTLEVMNNFELESALTQRSIDIAVARPYLLSSELQSSVLHTEPLILAHPTTMFQEEAGRISLQSLRSVPFILYPARPRPSFADHVIRVCSASGFAPVEIIRVQDFLTAISMVGAGIGVSLVPQSVSSIRCSAVSYSRYVGNNPGTLLTAHARLDNRSPQVRNFMKMVGDFSHNFRLSADLGLTGANDPQSFIFSLN